MRKLRHWADGDFGPKRPILFRDWPQESERPSSFMWEKGLLNQSFKPFTARLYYLNGWTALVFWNADVYFVDEFITFDGMIELLRSRIENAFYLGASLSREYVD